MVFELQNLTYDYNALEPHIDEETMKIHHDKHHKAYTDKLNKAIEGTDLEGKDIIEILKNTSEIPSGIKSAVVNNGGGFINHNMFWEILTPDFKEPSEDLLNEINSNFESLEKFKEIFKNAATTRFGSGWAWLVINSEGKLEVISTANQDNPISAGKTPILCLDVWEHAYYLKYQNKRPEYIKAFWNVVNWEKVEELLQISKK